VPAAAAASGPVRAPPAAPPGPPRPAGGGGALGLDDFFGVTANEGRTRIKRSPKKDEPPPG
jgi:hypothetical protein